MEAASGNEPLRSSTDPGRPIVSRSRELRDKEYQDHSAARQALDSEQQQRDLQQQVQDGQALQLRHPGPPTEWEIARLRAQEGRQTGQEFRQATQRLRIAAQLRNQERQVRDRIYENLRESARRIQERLAAIRGDDSPALRASDPTLTQEPAGGPKERARQRRKTWCQRQETERQQTEMIRQRAAMQLQRAESRRQWRELHGDETQTP